MNTIKKILLFAFITITTFLIAQQSPPAPPIDDGTNGVGGPGAPTPVDMYVYVLLFIAMIFIFHYSRKMMKRAT